MEFLICMQKKEKNRIDDVWEVHKTTQHKYKHKTKSHTIEKRASKTKDEAKTKTENKLYHKVP